MLIAGSMMALALLWPVLGFFAAISIWSLFVGDFLASGTTTHAVTVSRARQNVNPHNQPEPVWKGWNNVQYIYAFGDSYTSTFFDPKGPQPSKELPFGNSDLALPDSDQAIAAPTWIQYLQYVYNAGNNSLVYNYAVDEGHVERHAYENRPQFMGPSDKCVTLKEQVRCWNKKYSPPAWKGIPRNWTSEDSLFIIWFGMNDIVHGASKLPLEFAVDPIFGSYSASFERLYREGARNFLILNAPPVQLGLGPFTPTGAIATIQDTFNKRIDLMREKWLSRHSDATVFRFDTDRLFRDILQRPKGFPQTSDLKETKSYCEAYRSATTLEAKDANCEFARNEYFWAYKGHVSHPVHQALAASVVSECFSSAGADHYCI